MSPLPLVPPVSSWFINWSFEGDRMTKCGIFQAEINKRISVLRGCSEIGDSQRTNNA